MLLLGEEDAAAPLQRCQGPGLASFRLHVAVYSNTTQYLCWGSMSRRIHRAKRMNHRRLEERLERAAILPFALGHASAGTKLHP